MSTDEGIQIDESDEQSPNAASPIRETLRPSTNRPIETVLHPSKQQEHNSVIEAGMITSEAFPKYSTIELPSEFCKKESEILKWRPISSQRKPNRRNEQVWEESKGMTVMHSQKRPSFQFVRVEIDFRSSLPASYRSVCHSLAFLNGSFVARVRMKRAQPLLQ
jgi:hypothetical protein